ncbi:MAG: adenylate/guanylate cyclase domain-containing protein, partial [Planctomycetales bacterium]|nr:adenylate/guanylate cyclase domain-containing protein [Planctomycetales bacterium]
FCDVRGFSRKVEAARDLHSLLQQVSHVLSVMTRSILKYEGVIADFQGDAALGFWGWPSENEEGASMACRAALLIHDTFANAQQDSKHPLHGFNVGIGLAHGDAIAGQIGAEEQIKVGVFGPVVNLASRLQDFTKLVGVPILMDGPMAEKLALSSLNPDDASLRHLGSFRPPGLDNAVDVHALLSSAMAAPLERELVSAHHRAVDAMRAGDWEAARGLLRGLAARDKPSEFLLGVLSKSGKNPPIDWDRVFQVDREGTVSCRTGKTTQIMRPGEE